MATLLWLIPIIALTAWAAVYTLRRGKKGGGCCGDKEETVSKAAVRDKNKSHYPYTASVQIGGMTCENCARRVENALNALDGVWAKVSLGENTALLRCKASPDETAIRSAVSKAGYVVMNYKLG